MTSMTRRAALFGAGALTAGLTAGGLALAAPAKKAAGKSSFETRPGVQLWTVNAEIQKDVEGTLKHLYELGYRRVETAGYVNRTPAQFSAAVKAAGLTCDSVHHSAGDLMTDLPGKISAARDMGAKWLVCSSPAPNSPLQMKPGQSWMSAMGEAMTADAWKRNFELLAKAGAAAKAAGLKLGYHNHMMEFAQVGGFVPMEEMIRTVGGDLLRIELDVGWAAAANVDPVDFLKRHAGRVDLLHIKDLKAHVKNGEEPISMEVGQGVVDWAGVFKTAKATGVKTWFVEQEAPFVRPVWESLAMSLAYIKKLPA